VEVVASLSQGRTAAAQCGLFTHKSVPAIFEPPCISSYYGHLFQNTGTFNSATPALSIRNLEIAAVLPPLPE